MKETINCGPHRAMPAQICTMTKMCQPTSLLQDDDEEEARLLILFLSRKLEIANFDTIKTLVVPKEDICHQIGHRMEFVVCRCSQ